jgi:hypothetical protein
MSSSGIVENTDPPKSKGAKLYAETPVHPSQAATVQELDGCGVRLVTSGVAPGVEERVIVDAGL